MAPLSGKTVKIVGTSKNELNGQTGTATLFDEAKDRYRVTLADGKTVALRPFNLHEVTEKDKEKAAHRPWSQRVREAVYTDGKLFGRTPGGWGKRMMWHMGSAIVVLLVTLWWKQEAIIYANGMMNHPRSENPEMYRSPKEHNVVFEDEFVPTADGQVHAWVMRAKSDEEQETATRPVMVYFHPNAGNLGYHMPDAVTILKKCDVNVVVFSYRGYGESPGQPTQAGLLTDARAVTQHALQKFGAEKLYYLGFSIGGAVAIHMAAEQQDTVAGVVVVNAFASVLEMALGTFPFLRPAAPVLPYLIRDPWRNGEVIPTLQMPLLFLSSGRDEIVPSAQMARLYELAGSTAKSMVVAENATHNTLPAVMGSRYYDSICKFIADAEVAVAT